MRKRIGLTKAMVPSIQPRAFLDDPRGEGGGAGGRGRCFSLKAGIRLLAVKKCCGLTPPYRVWVGSG